MSAKPSPLPDVYDRFLAIYQALGAERDVWNDAVWLRFAAYAAVLRSGTPAAIAHAIRTGGEGLRTHASWFDALSSPIRFMMAGILIQSGGNVRGFCDALERTRRGFDDVGLRHRDGYDVISAAIIHLMHRGRPLSLLQMESIKAIHSEMKKLHWWLTGPEDVPACVLLSFRQEDAHVLAAEAEAIYQRLSAHEFMKGDRLQTAANLLVLTGQTTAVATKRFDDLAIACTALDMPMLADDYEALALLTLLDRDPATVARRCHAIRERLANLEPPLHGTVAFALASDLTFLDLARMGRDGQPLTAGPDLERMLTVLNLHYAASAIVAMDAANVAMAIDAIPMQPWPFLGA